MAAVAIDVEKVWLDGERGEFPVRVSIVDEDLKVLLDLYVSPTEQVKDFRTNIHGISQEILMTKGVSFAVARKEVVALIGDKLVVGHDLLGDLKCCLVEVPQSRMRDTATARMFAIKKVSESGDTFYNKPSLKDMALEHLKQTIQVGVHSSVEDATAAMKLYKMFKAKSLQDWMPMS